MALVKAFLVAVVGSLVANLALLFAVRPLVTDPAMPLNALNVGPVVTFTVGGVVGATIVYALLRRFTAQPNRIFLWVSAVVLVLSFIPDLMIIGQTTGPFAGGNLGSALVLMLMHVAVAAITVWALLRFWGERPAGA